MPKPLRLAFLGNREVSYACLERLLQEDGLSVAAAVIHEEGFDPGTTASRAKMLDLCRRHDIPVFSVGKIADIAAELRSLGLDLMVSVGFMSLIPEGVYSLPPHGCLNVHAGMLPKYRGRYPLNWALFNGEKEFGITVHQVDEGIDSGNIIHQEGFPITADDDAASLYEHMVAQLPAVLARGVRRIAAGKGRPHRQREEKVIYYPNIPEAARRIDWGQASQDVYGRVRAFVNIEGGAFCLYEGRTIGVSKAALVTRPAFKGLAGHILEVSTRGALVKTGDGVILLTHLKVDGKVVDAPAVLQKGRVLV